MQNRAHISVSTLGSGSRGNCTLVSDGYHGLLVDCGISTKQIMKRMEQIGAEGLSIDGILITHEHSDHIGAARILEKALQRRQGREVPFFMSPGTARNLPPRCRPNHIVEVHPDRPFRIEQWLIEPLSVPHDTSEPMAFTIQGANRRIGIFTDMGHIPAAVTRQLATLDLLVLEFNYDRTMLENGPYPYRLKQRVRGPYGHLSNDQAAQLIREFGTHRLQHVVLAHMSQDNNTIDKAYLACQQALSDAGLKQVQIHVADQVNPLNPIGLPTHYTGNRPKTSPKPKLSTHTATNQPTLFPEL